MFSCSNKADLKLLEEMGITPEESMREKRPSLKSVGVAVIATIRMQRMRERWAEHKRVQESIVRKLEGMRKGAGLSAGVGPGAIKGRAR